MNKKIDDFKSAFDERDYRFRRLELLIYGIYALLMFFMGLPYLMILGVFTG